jgi:amino acid adenylation domain-containing protein
MTVSPGTAEGLSSTPEQRPEQLRLLELRMRRSAAPGPIPGRRQNGSARLSSAQALLWYFCRNEGGNSIYTLPRIFEIEGPLDVPRLRSALSRVVERHEALRTVFQKRDGAPLQIVQPASQSASQAMLPVVDLAAGEVEAWLRQESARTINLGAGPLFQARLARTGDQRHILVLLWHHIVCDYRSGRILDEEIGSIYAGREPEQPAVQFGDYAEWELTRLQSHDAEKARSFWKGYLADAPPLIDLAFGRIRPAEPGYKGQTQVFELDPALAAQIRAFGRTRRVTLFPVFLAAWVLLLSRYSNCNDLVVRVPVSGRDVPELEKLIGYFVNMLPLRLEVQPLATFEDLVRDCWARFVQCSAAALPFDAIMDAVRPGRNRSYSSLFQLSMNYLREGKTGLQLEGTTTRKIPFRNDASPFDLTLTVLDRPSLFRITLEYNVALFDSRTIGQMGGHFLRILQEAAVPETLSLGAIRMLSPEERYAAVNTRNATEEPIDGNATVLTWFDRRAAGNPGKVAVRSGEVEWSYGELNAFASRVCTALEGQGIQPGDVVAVHAERSPETVGVILGIWKCGAVWLPVDPRWPSERAQFVIRDSGAKTVIDSGWLRNHLPAESSAARLPVLPDFVAYILYTSGSAGQPKGVAIQHGSLLNCLLSVLRCPGLTTDDTLLSVSPLSFDISLCELCLPLISGAALLLPSLATATNPRAVKRLLEENDVTVMQATPFMWRSVIEEGWKGSPKLRAWCGGETLPPELADSLLDRAAQVWNLYGATETAMLSTVHRVSRRESPVPIGRPIANTQCYVLDANLQPVPDGVPGELFIGGAGVSPGYNGHAKTFNESFLPNPFIPGGRMYRTGDVVRWSANPLESSGASLVFRRRNDTQVTVRGDRIELGEVETVLSRLPAVGQAVVAVHDEALVAWIVAAEDALWDPQQLRKELRARLPEYMVPGIFIPLDRLPLNSRGKVDRKKLPAPRKGSGRPGEQNAAHRATPPADMIEQALIDLWEELLDVRPVGLEDNFFDLGGHSLLAAKLFSKIERVFGKLLPDSVLFQAPTVAGFASILRAQGGGGFSSLVPLQPQGDRPILFLIHGAGGSVLSLRELGRCFGPDQPVYGLQSVGSDGTRPHHIRIEEMARHYLCEIRTLQPEGPYYLCGYCFGGLVALEMAQQLTAGGEQIAFLSVIDGIVGMRSKLNSPRNTGHIPRLLRHARRHFRAWRPLSAREKLSYLYSRVFTRSFRLLFEAAYKAHFPAAIPIPSGILPVSVAHRIALKRYRPLPYSHAITLFNAAPMERLFPRNPSLEWAAIAPNRLEIEEIPGTHGTALYQPHVQVLAARLGHRLRIAQDRQP